MLQAAQMEDEDDASPRSQSSQASSSGQKQSLPSSQKESTQKFRWADYPDSQDPYDLNED